jgi:D-sedoheptulose 7-phosphate isomerase
MLTFSKYREELARVLAHIDENAFNAVVDAIKHIQETDKVIYVCGNGGSASTASHMVNDLVKAPADASGCRPIRAFALTDCVPLMTAFANDVEYAQAFARQLDAYGREGDLLVAISGSGNSANVLEAAKVAKSKGLSVVGFTGFQGGRLGPLCDIHVNVPCESMAQVEDAHLIMEHALVEVLKEAFGGRSSVNTGKD